MMRAPTRKHEASPDLQQWVLPANENDTGTSEAVSVTVDLLKDTNPSSFDARYIATLRSGNEVYFKSEAFFTETAALKRLEALLIEGGWRKLAPPHHYSYWQHLLMRLGLSHKFEMGSVARVV